MDVNGVETVTVNALGGADTVNHRTISAEPTSRRSTSISAARSAERPATAQADTVTVNGTNGGDIVDVFGAGTSVSVLGLAAVVNITGSEGQNDTLVIKTLGGNDGVTATTLPAGVMKLTIDSGAGNDTIFGSQGADTFIAGDGNDFVFGDNGNDLALTSAPATTCSSGIPATATTRSKARTALTGCSSSAPTSTRTSTSSPTAAARCLPATSPTSRWT